MAQQPEERIDYTEPYALIATQVQQLANRARELGLPFLIAFQAKWPQVNAHLPHGSDPDLIDAAHALGVNKYTRLARLEEEQLAQEEEQRRKGAI